MRLYEKIKVIGILRNWDKKGKFVFTKHELRKLFPEDNPKTFSEGLNRLTKTNLLKELAAESMSIFMHSLHNFRLILNND